MAAVQDFESVTTAVSYVSSNLVQLRYAVFFFGRRPLSRSHDLTPEIRIERDYIIADILFGSELKKRKNINIVFHILVDQ